MGIDAYSLDFLLRVAKRGLGRTLALGRQVLAFDSEDPLVATVLRDHGVSLRDVLGGPAAAGEFDETDYLLFNADVAQAVRDGLFYCGRQHYELIGRSENRRWMSAEPLFGFLGSTSVVSMDISKIEGAKIIHDLNRPVPRKLTRAFDAIYDGGTLEHVFNFPVAIANVHRMLATGGMFLMATGANNWLGHGFYQFSPELMWRVLAPEFGFEMTAMYLVDADGVPTPRELSDPAGIRQEIGATNARTYLLVAATKTHEPIRQLNAVYQSDYVSKWPETRTEAGSRRPRCGVGRLWPWITMK